MTTKDNTLIFLEGDEKIIVVDFSDPRSPAVRGSYYDITHDLFFDGNHLFSVTISPQNKLSVYELNK